MVRNWGGNSHPVSMADNLSSTSGVSSNGRLPGRVAAAAVNWPSQPLPLQPSLVVDDRPLFVALRLLLLLLFLLVLAALATLCRWIPHLGSLVWRLC